MSKNLLLLNSHKTELLCCLCKLIIVLPPNAQLLKTSVLHSTVTFPVPYKSIFHCFLYQVLQTNHVWNRKSIRRCWVIANWQLGELKKGKTQLSSDLSKHICLQHLKCFSSVVEVPPRKIPHPPVRIDAANSTRNSGVQLLTKTSLYSQC